MSRLSRPLQAILLMLCSMATFAAMNTVIRLLSGSLHPTQMVLIRNLFSFLLIVLWSTGLQKGLPRFPTQRLKSHFWRASVGIIAMELWFYSVTLMPLTLATALSFTTPIFSTIFAILFLGEKAGIRRWSAVALGLVGMLIILHPDRHLHWSAGIVLLSSAMMAVSGVLVKSLTRTEASETIVFYMSLFMIPWSFPPAIWHWQPISQHQLALLFLVALFSTASHLMLVRALKRADLVMLMPFDFTRLVFTAAFAYMLFDERMDIYTLAGSLVIVSSAVYIAHREARDRVRAAIMTVPG